MSMPLKKRIDAYIRASKAEIFVRADFERFGSYAQIGRILRQFVDEGRLVKVGYGLYAKATTSSLSGRPIPRICLKEIAYEALAKLGVEADLTWAEKEYRDGRSTQVPARPRVNVGESRIRRAIGFKGKIVGFERNSDVRRRKRILRAWGHQVEE